MAKRKILFCTQTYTPIGGVETWLDILCRGLTEKGWQPVVGLVRGAKVHRPEAWIEAHPGLDTIEIDGSGLPVEGRVRAIMRCIRQVKPDIFVPVSIVDAFDAISHMKLRGSAVRHVMTIQGNIPSLIADMQRYKDFADLLVCPGALTSRMATDWAGFPENRVRHIPNGALRPFAEHLPRIVGQPIRLGYVGRLSQADKRVMDLVSFCSHLEIQGVNYSLEIVGSGSARDDLERCMNEHLSETAVRFCGQISLNELYQKVYPNLDCLLLFSPSEAFGISVVEAMMHGVVPVTSRFVGHVSERILFDGKTALLFDVGDTKAAASCVRKLAEDHELWSRLASQGKKQVLEKYPWDRSISKWASAFEEALSVPPAVGRYLPDKPLGPKGTLDRLGIPSILIDLFRRGRRFIFGIPPGMIGGEEWPFVNKDHDPNLLESIRLFAEQLDKTSNGKSFSFPDL